jgi:hypothetical protein
VDGQVAQGIQRWNAPDWEDLIAKSGIVQAEIFRAVNREVLVGEPEGFYSGVLASTHLRKSATCSSGHFPSHGIVPLAKRSRMAWACVLTLW